MSSTPLVLEQEMRYYCFVRTFKTFFSFFICVSFLLVSLVTFNAFGALPKSFYDHEKKEKLKESKRYSASSGMRAKRQKAESERYKKSKAYKKVRSKKLKSRTRRQKQYEKFEKKKLQQESKRSSRAKNFLKGKRKSSKSNWKDQNIEYGIDRFIEVKKEN